MFGGFGKQISNRCVDVVTLKCADLFIWKKSCTGHVILLTFLFTFERHQLRSFTIFKFVILVEFSLKFARDFTCICY